MSTAHVALVAGVDRSYSHCADENDRKWSPEDQVREEVNDESVQPAVAVIERLEQRVISKVASDDLEARH